MKILILLALVLDEKEIALAALGVIVTLSQRPPPDTPAPPGNTELSVKGTSLPAPETKEPTAPPLPPEPPTCLAGV